MFLASISVSVAADPSASSTDEWVAPARAARKENPVAANAASIEKGKTLYMQGCMACHGTAGKGDGPAAASLVFNGKPVHPRNLADPKMNDQSDGTLFWKITEGRTLMPSFSQIFTDEQRWTLINYIRTLAPKDAAVGNEKKNGDKP